MSRWLLAGLALALGIGLALRAPGLTLRPFHNDEGVNAMKFRRLYVNNNYKYDPNEFHGPTLPYLTLPSACLRGSGSFNDFSEATYRSVTVAFGSGLILLLLFLAPDFGREETLWAAVLIAVSPAMVFYSRYYIHEMLLVFFTAWTFICFWKYSRLAHAFGERTRLAGGRLVSLPAASLPHDKAIGGGADGDTRGACAPLNNSRVAGTGCAGWAVAGGLGLGLMWATKETFVFALAAMALAMGTNFVWSRIRGDEEAKLVWQWKWTYPVSLLVAATTAALFFSSFCTNPAGLLDSVRSYLPWFQRAGGATEHVHGWSFYFERLLFFHVLGGPIWSEAFIVALALVGFVGALRGRSLLLRVIAFYTFWLTLIYTLLPYKTPWCLLGFYHGAILLAGAGAALFRRACRPGWLKSALALVLVAGVIQLGWQSWRGNFGVDSKGVAYCVSAKNPYVYSQTLPDALRLTATVEGIARANPEGYGTVLEVMARDSYWPLPWYFRRFTNVGYWDKIPEQPLAPIMVVAANLKANFDEQPGKTHLMAGYFELRPQVFLELYVKTNLWAAYVKTLPPEKD
jgi:uncharacterized protein (TIGR03663 family)